MGFRKIVQRMARMGEGTREASAWEVRAERLLLAVGWDTPSEDAVTEIADVLYGSWIQTREIAVWKAIAQAAVTERLLERIADALDASGIGTAEVDEGAAGRVLVTMDGLTLALRADGLIWFGSLSPFMQAEAQRVRALLDARQAEEDAALLRGEEG